MPGGPHEIEIVLTDDPALPTRWARIVRTHHGASVQRKLLGTPAGNQRQPETEFDSWERAIACTNRWLHGQEWSW